MNVLITYDISVTTKDGRRRLAKIAKVCLNYGLRVQNSVYECDVDSSQLFNLKNEVLSLYNEDEDSIRIYKLGKNYKTSVQHFGVKSTLKPDEPIIF